MNPPARPADTACLDGLRGLAALIVIASHASLQGMDLLPGLDLGGSGKYGVYLFFVLSAYLLSTQWLALEPAVRTSPAILGRYLLRRVLRIYPLYTLVLLVGLALAPRGLGVPLDAAAVFRHLTLQEGLDLYWSIPVEFLYYLVIPVLCIWLGGGRLPWWLKLAGVFLALLLVSSRFPPAQAPANGSNLMYYLPIFVCGTLAAWWQGNHPVLPGPKSAGMALDVLAPLLYALTLPAVFIALHLSDQIDALHRYFLAWGIAWSAVLLGLLRGWLPGWRKVLSLPALRSCGRWSFSIYLLHMPALYLVKRLPAPHLVQAWAGLGLALVVAAMAHQWVERPAMKLGR